MSACVLMGEENKILICCVRLGSQPIDWGAYKKKRWTSSIEEEEGGF